jgi:hypothetical protein
VAVVGIFATEGVVMVELEAVDGSATRPLRGASATGSDSVVDAGNGTATAVGILCAALS